MLQPQPRSLLKSMPHAADDIKLFAAYADKRIVAIKRHDQKVWIKRQDIERRPFSKWLHGKLSWLFPAPFMRASPLRSPQEMNEQEIRKIIAFQKAGLAVPTILAVEDSALMISDVGETIQKRLKTLRKQDPKRHDALLIECAIALGKVHEKGLVHGRPHPRDMFFQGLELGFFDFEEEPEAVMPLSTAQARDAWLLFFQISSLALDKQTEEAAFQAWEKHVSDETLEDLSKIIAFFSLFLPLLELTRLIWLGADGQRMLSAIKFIHSHLKGKK